MNIKTIGIVYFFWSVLLSACTQDGTGAASADPQNISVNDEAEQTALDLDFSAHWLRPEVLYITPHKNAENFKLYYSLSGEIKDNVEKVGDKAIQSMILGSSSYFNLSSLEVKAADAAGLRAPSSAHRSFTIAESIEPAAIKLMLRGQLRVVQENAQGQIVKSSRVQFAKLLDALYTNAKNDADEVSDYGAVVRANNVRFKVWAPTALELKVLVFDQNKKPLKPAAYDMEFDSNTGVWTAVGPSRLKFAFYQYAIKIYHPASDKIENLISTDPYSLSLSTNSVYSQVVDLSDPATKPFGWDEHKVPSLAKYEDSILYEVHVRDFSAVEKNLSDPQARGKYKAFSEASSDGIKHLQALREAGLTHIHLLPIFDIATVDEDPAKRVSLDDSVSKLCVIKTDLPLCQDEKNQSRRLREVLESYDNSSGEAQALIEAIRHIDDYNWGYDPYHYTVPEGSYAINPDGYSRLVEFREMVKRFHEMGFRVVMDVVYNHTHSNEITGNRLHTYAVLDKFVPNYYNRINPLSGEIEKSTCCDNTATEHVMMGKLMVDSLITWTRDYKIDGFRFDLMGHQPKPLMLSAYDAVRAIDPDNYFYGEGWNFGEVADNALFVQASQQELAGSEIGTFSDRLRDAVRGPGFNSGAEVRKAQGIGNGLYVLPNDLAKDKQGKVSKDMRSRFYTNKDQLRIGLAGNLANYPLINHQDKRVSGKDIPYGDAPTGYALDPADTINYVSKHDNQSLWDNHQYRLPYSLGTDERVRLHLLSLSYPLLAQGIPFIHMGSELLRSKSFLRDSYDYGDWFNAVDFSQQNNNYHVGLPAETKDADKWPVIKDLLEKNQGRDIPSPEHIAYASQIFQEFLRIRQSSELFRLADETSIIERLDFLNTGSEQIPGLIVMELRDGGDLPILDKRFEKILVLFNSAGDAATFSYSQAGDFQLHPVQAEGRDTLLQKELALTDRSISVPGFSATVLVKPRR